MVRSTQFSRLFCLCAFFLVAIIVPAAVGAQKPPVLGKDTPYTNIPGTRISLQIPDGFSIADTFVGIMKEDAASSVLVAEIPVPYSEMLAKLENGGLASQGVELLEAWNIVGEGEESKYGPGNPPPVLLFARQSSQGLEMRKWYRLDGDAASTIMIMATFPVSIENHYSPLLEQVVLSAYWDKDGAKSSPNLPFTVDETPDFKRLDMPSLGPILILGDPSIKGRKRAASPKILFAAWETPIGADTTLSTLAHRRINTLQSLRDIKIRRETETTMGGMRAHQLLADAVLAEDGAPMTVRVVVLPTNSGLFVMVAETQAEAWSNLVAQIDLMQASFRLNR